MGTAANKMNNEHSTQTLKETLLPEHCDNGVLLTEGKWGLKKKASAQCNARRSLELS